MTVMISKKTHLVVSYSPDATLRSGEKTVFVHQQTAWTVHTLHRCIHRYNITVKLILNVLPLSSSFPPSQLLAH